MRVAIVIASTWSWVTYTTVVSSRRCSSTSSARVATRNLASRFESGSSIRKASGRRTIARASATRWRCPPESWAGLRSSSSSRPRMRGGFEHELRPLLGADLAGSQRELDVPAHRHVRVQRVALEHHRDVAILRLDVVHDAVADADRCRRSGPRDRRSSAARSTCRSPTDRAGRGTRWSATSSERSSTAATSPKRLVTRSRTTWAMRPEHYAAEEPAAGVPMAQGRDLFGRRWRQLGDCVHDVEVPTARGARGLDPGGERFVARRDGRQHELRRPASRGRRGR